MRCLLAALTVDINIIIYHAQFQFQVFHPSHGLSFRPMPQVLQPNTKHIMLYRADQYGIDLNPNQRLICGLVGPIMIVGSEKSPKDCHSAMWM